MKKVHLCTACKRPIHGTRRTLHAYVDEPSADGKSSHRIFSELTRHFHEKCAPSQEDVWRMFSSDHEAQPLLAAYPHLHVPKTDELLQGLREHDFFAAPGWTRADVKEKLSMTHPPLSELEEAGLIERTGRKRPDPLSKREVLTYRLLERSVS